MSAPRRFDHEPHCPEHGYGHARNETFSCVCDAYAPPPQPKRPGFWKRVGNAVGEGLAKILMAGTGAGGMR